MNDSKRGEDFLRGMGSAAMGGWLRRLSDRVDREASALYAAAGVEFEQRWFGVLNQLALNGAMAVGEIAQALGVTHVAVSQTRQSLMKAGMVMAEPDARDGRSRRLRLTAKGQAFYLDTLPLWEALARAAAELDREAGGVTAALMRLEDALDRRPLAARVRIPSGRS